MLPQEAIDLIKSILVKNPANRPTLEEILESPFMTMGQDLTNTTQLNSKCPLRNNFNENSFLQNRNASVSKNKKSLHRRVNSGIDLRRKITKDDPTKENTKEAQYVTELYPVKNSGHFYELDNGTRAVTTSDKCVLFRNNDHKLIKFNFSSGDQEVMTS